MRDFQFHTPATLADAHSLLNDHGEDARVMSGGTGLINMMKQDLIYVDHLVSLQNIGNLSYIRWTDEGLQVGGRTTQQEMAMSDVLHERLPLLKETYSEVATVRVRNSATVGGGVAHGDPAQDPPPTLLVLDASVNVASKDGERTVKVRDGWFVDYYTTGVEQGEIVTSITVPPRLRTPGARTSSSCRAPRTIIPPSQSPPSESWTAGLSQTYASGSAPSTPRPFMPRASRAFWLGRRRRLIW